MSNHLDLANQNRGKAPRTMDVEGRRIITPDAERDWRLEHECDAAEAKCPVPLRAANPTNQREI